MIYHKETKEAFLALTSSLVEQLEAITGVNHETLVSDGYWDGKAEAEDSKPKDWADALQYASASYA